MMEMPAPLERLPELARDLWWSWHQEARALFDALVDSVDEPLHHNPVRLLQSMSSAELEALGPRRFRWTHPLAQDRDAPSQEGFRRVWRSRAGTDARGENQE